MAGGVDAKCPHPAEAFFAAFRASRKIPDAWEAWRGYREQVTDYILENSQPGTSLAVFGAGRLNDLSLPRLLKHFSRVTLLDIDEEAMREAVQRDGNFWEYEKDLRQEDIGLGEIRREESARLTIFPVDFVGIAEEDYIALADTLLQIGRKQISYEPAKAELFSQGDAKERDELTQMYAKAAGELSRMYAKSRAHVPKLPQEIYDYTVALGVHSQLGNVPAWLFDAAGISLSKAGRQPCLGAEFWREIREDLFASMERESAFLSERFNELILSATKRKAFIGCEISRAVCEDGVWYAVPDSAVSGAWQAAEDIKRRAACGGIRFEHYLDIVWPFFMAEQKAYRMMVMECERSRKLVKGFRE